MADNDTGFFKCPECGLLDKRRARCECGYAIEDSVPKDETDAERVSSTTATTQPRFTLRSIFVIVSLLACSAALFRLAPCLALPLAILVLGYCFVLGCRVLHSWSRRAFFYVIATAGVVCLLVSVIGCIWIYRIYEFGGTLGVVMLPDTLVEMRIARIKGQAESEAIPELRRLMREGTSAERAYAINALDVFGPAGHVAAPELAEFGMTMTGRYSWAKLNSRGMLAQMDSESLKPAVREIVALSRRTDRGREYEYIAQQLLTKIGIDGLGDLLRNDRDPSFREAAAHGLRLIARDGAATEHFVAALDDPHASVRRAAMPGLWYSSEDVIPRLEPLLDDESNDVRAQATTMLAEIREKANLYKIAGERVANVRTLPPLDAVSELRRLLRGNDPYTRAHAIKALRDLGPAAHVAAPEVVGYGLTTPTLPIGSGSPYEESRAMLLQMDAEALQSAVRQIAELLHRGLNEPRREWERDNDVARELLEIIGIDPLGDILRNDGWDMRREAAARCLAFIAPDGEATEHLVEALDDPSVRVRFEAIRGLSGSSEDVIPRLEPLLEDENPNVRAFTSRVIGKIRDKASKVRAAPSSLRRDGDG